MLCSNVWDLRQHKWIHFQQLTHRFFLKCSFKWVWPAPVVAILTASSSSSLFLADWMPFGIRLPLTGPVFDSILVHLNSLLIQIQRGGGSRTVVGGQSWKQEAQNVSQHTAVSQASLISPRGRHVHARNLCKFPVFMTCSWDALERSFTLSHFDYCLLPEHWCFIAVQRRHTGASFPRVYKCLSLNMEWKHGNI